MLADGGVRGGDSAVVGGGSLERWVWRVLNTWEEEKISKWAAVLWALWRERNQRVWNSEATISSRIVGVGVQLIQEWRDVRKKEVRGGREVGDRSVVCSRWHPPNGQKLKCNVDRGIRVADRRWSRGMIIRDHQGNMVRCRAAWSAGLPEPREGEALALLDVMVWIEEEGFQQVIFEVDSEIVAGAVNGRDEDLSEFEFKGSKQQGESDHQEVSCIEPKTLKSLMPHPATKVERTLLVSLK
ncbi:hypothetical protein LINPERHAP1_LOCUS13455 [Linum perenne]